MHSFLLFIRYVSKHVEPSAAFHDFYALSRADIRRASAETPPHTDTDTGAERLYCFPPPGTVARAVAKLAALGASGVLVAFDAEALRLPELRRRRRRRARGGGGHGREGEGERERDWGGEDEDGGAAGVGPWIALGPHAGWWPLASGRWEQRGAADPPLGTDALPRSPHVRGGGRPQQPPQLVAIPFRFVVQNASSGKAVLESSADSR